MRDEPTTTNLTLVEATIYDNITEENGRGEVLNALRTLKARVAYLESLLSDIKNETLSVNPVTRGGAIDSIITILDNAGV